MFYFDVVVAWDEEILSARNQNETISLKTTWKILEDNVMFFDVVVVVELWLEEIYKKYHCALWETSTIDASWHLEILEETILFLTYVFSCHGKLYNLFFEDFRKISSDFIHYSFLQGWFPPRKFSSPFRVPPTRKGKNSFAPPPFWDIFAQFSEIL